MRGARRGAAAVLFTAASMHAMAQEAALVAYRVAAGAIDAPLTGAAGDAARGREVVRERSAGNCLLCHSVPGTGDSFMGDLGPPLAGVGARFSTSQLRLRLVDAARVVPDTIMPSYYRVDGLNMVAAAWRGRPILEAQQIEDAVAFLATLRGEAR